MLPRTPITEKVGLVLCRVIVPLWIFAGVFFKLQAGDPRHLPGVIWQNFRALVQWWETSPEWLNLSTLLYTLIGLEIFAIGVMLFIARLAKPMAIFMLTSFCLILIAELIRGAESCGCFGGTITVKPWQMLLLDGVLLAGVILFPIRGGLTRRDDTDLKPSLAMPIVVASGLLIVGLVTSFTIGKALHPERTQQAIEDDGTGEGMINPSPRNLPGFWYAADLNAWIGKSWRDADLFQLMPRWPRGLDEGRFYVVFYNRTCEHCREMFEADFTRELGAPVIAIEIPASRTRMTSPDAWPKPSPEQLIAVEQELELPLGTDWVIQSPLSLRIEDGVITCAIEGCHIECLELH